MIVPMSVAVWLIDGSAEAAPGGATRWASLKSAFAAGWWWGFGYHLAGLWWLGSAFLVDADQFLWALPLGVVGLPIFLALFPALGFALARVIWPHRLRPVALGVGLALSEFARANLLSGFPWNEYGMAFGQLLAGPARARRPAWPDLDRRDPLRRARDAACRRAPDLAGGAGRRVADRIRRMARLRCRGRA